MPFEQLAYSWKIYRILRRLAKQRVRLVLQPGNVWVIEYAVPDDEETDALLKSKINRVIGSDSIDCTTID